MMTHRAYTVFQGRAGDHNDLAMPAARALGEALALRTGQAPTIIGEPAPALNTGWREELDAALPALREVQARFEDVAASKAVSIAAMSRCAVSLATLPVIAKHNPGVCIVWFDSHADRGHSRRGHNFSPIPVSNAVSFCYLTEPRLRVFTFTAT